MKARIRWRSDGRVLSSCDLCSSRSLRLLLVLDSSVNRSKCCISVTFQQGRSAVFHSTGCLKRYDSILPSHIYRTCTASTVLRSLHRGARPSSCGSRRPSEESYPEADVPAHPRSGCAMVCDLGSGRPWRVGDRACACLLRRRLDACRGRSDRGERRGFPCGHRCQPALVRRRLEGVLHSSLQADASSWKIWYLIRQVDAIVESIPADSVRLRSRVDWICLSARQTLANIHSADQNPSPFLMLKSFGSRFISLFCQVQRHGNPNSSAAAVGDCTVSPTTLFDRVETRMCSGKGGEDLERDNDNPLFWPLGECFTTSQRQLSSRQACGQCFMVNSSQR